MSTACLTSSLASSDDPCDTVISCALSRAKSISPPPARAGNSFGRGVSVPERRLPASHRPDSRRDLRLPKGSDYSPAAETGQEHATTPRKRGQAHILGDLVDVGSLLGTCSRSRASWHLFAFTCLCTTPTLTAAGETSCQIDYINVHDSRTPVGWAERSETHAYPASGRPSETRGSRCARPTLRLGCDCPLSPFSLHPPGLDAVGRGHDQGGLAGQRRRGQTVYRGAVVEAID